MLSCTRRETVDVNTLITARIVEKNHAEASRPAKRIRRRYISNDIIIY